MINIVVTSKPVDGLFYYSYEYCDMLNKAGYSAQVIVITHRNFAKDDYLTSIKNKYIHCHNILIDEYVPSLNDITLIMGRSMMTLSWQSFNDYNETQQRILKRLFSDKLISVYSENHPTKYLQAIEFYKPQRIIDLCDNEVYPNGVGRHFEKTINFDIHKHPKKNTQFKHLFLGTNKEYYASVEAVIDQFPDHGILTYDAEYINNKYNNLFVPVENLMGLFETYIYTKSTFDPAPRIFQECKYYSKDVIYNRDKSIKDGGSVYWNRNIGKPNIQPILETVEELNEKVSN